MTTRFVLALALCAFVGVAAAQDRFALVIGNGKYPGAAALKNPPNDAATVSAALEKLEFKVTKVTDADLAATEKAVLAFRKSLTKKSFALFFYAGHGLQVKGENFLVPVDSDVQEESQVKRKCFPVDGLLTELESSNAALKVVILDACRDNPNFRSWSQNIGKGLASTTQLPDKTVIAFSAAPGKAALDGRGDNSPYTQHLVASLNRRPTEGLELIDALREASREVKKETGQITWLNLDVSVEHFYLWKGGATIASIPTPTPTPPPTPIPKSVAPPPTRPETKSVGRKALIIGNAKYDGAAELRNSTNDADAIAIALGKLDFEVTKLIDLDLAQLRTAVLQFHRTLKKGDVAFFFYAGHGLQVKGENFLVPLKAAPEAEFEVAEQCYKLDQVLDALESSEAALKIVVLDACRNNPLARSWTRDTSKKGLAKVEAPKGTLVAFSTASGATALDSGPGNRQNSPYTHQLVTHLNGRPKEGLELREVFLDASAAVEEQSGQEPWLHMTAIRKFYLWKEAK